MRRQGDVRGRVIYVQGRSAHGRISRDFWQNRPENVSTASAFADATHSDRGFASVFVTASDGLRLHIRSYGSSVASALPVLCLPGLARTAADFHPLATALAADPANPRLVLAVDYRGLQRTGIRCRGRWPTETGLRERRPLFLRGLISHICAADQLARARRSAISLKRLGRRSQLEGYTAT